MRLLLLMACQADCSACTQHAAPSQILHTTFAVDCTISTNVSEANCNIHLWSALSSDQCFGIPSGQALICKGCMRAVVPYTTVECMPVVIHCRLHSARDCCTLRYSRLDQPAIVNCTSTLYNRCFMILKKGISWSKRTVFCSDSIIFKLS